MPLFHSVSPVRAASQPESLTAVMGPVPDHGSVPEGRRVLPQLSAIELARLVTNEDISNLINEASSSQGIFARFVQDKIHAVNRSARPHRAHRFRATQSVRIGALEPEPSSSKSRREILPSIQNCPAYVGEDPTLEIHPDNSDQSQSAAIAAALVVSLGMLFTYDFSRGSMESDHCRNRSISIVYT